MNTPTRKRKQRTPKRPRNITTLPDVVNALSNDTSSYVPKNPDMFTTGWMLEPVGEMVAHERLLKSSYAKQFCAPKRQVKFSKLTYHGIWHILTQNVIPHANAIGYRCRNKLHYAHYKKDMIELVKIDKKVFYKFYDEAVEKNYIAKWQNQDKLSFFFINPTSFYNGNRYCWLPKLLPTLFEIT